MVAEGSEDNTSDDKKIFRFAVRSRCPGFEWGSANARSDEDRDFRGRLLLVHATALR
jgi:hypothetical protein